MEHAEVRLQNGLPKVVGSFGAPAALRAFSLRDALAASEIVEIRLDILHAECAARDRAAWAHLRGIPLLFTARRQDEGGAAALSARERADLVEGALEDAAIIDVEVRSIPQMHDLITEFRARNLPWVASFHNFGKLPSDSVLCEAAAEARSAGAAAFKLAAMLKSPGDLARLADFQLEDHGIPVATMGMGPLAPVSRLLCAQCGSVLNYGYLGDAPTAPGQWDSASLKEAIAKLVPFRR